MSRLEWDKTSERLYETGVKQCALYAWEKNAIDTGEYADSPINEAYPTPDNFSTTYYKVSSGTYSVVGSDAYDPTKEYYTFEDIETTPGTTDVTGKYEKSDTNPATYSATADTTAQLNKQYANITPISAKLASTWYKGLYERTGSSPDYVYTELTNSAVYSSTKHYCTKVYEDGYGVGVAWNGVTAINETPTGAEATDLYADDMKYLSLLSAEELEGTIEAYMYPDEWEQCDGSASSDGITFGQQSRKQFCLAYVTTVGNDTDGNEFGEKLHLLYNAKATPSERAYATINDSPEAITFSWSLKATKEKISDTMKEAVKDALGIDLKDTALITISKVDKEGKPTPHYETIYNAVYGTKNDDPRILLPDDICAILTGANTEG